MFESVGYFRTILIEELGPSGSSTWLALHPDLPGCNAAAEKQEDALRGLEMSRDAWMSVAEAQGWPVPKALEHRSLRVYYAVNPAAYFNGEMGASPAKLVPISEPSELS